MADIDALKARIKSLNARATQAKMDLHDLSEELPLGWQKIPDVAARTHELYAELTAARDALKTAAG
ncbi:MAG: CCE_0567 family metalloprotein [Rhodospirillaceae bacterium]